jgi:hypothetical protein
MWHSIKRWRDWVDNLGPPFRFRPQVRSLHIDFELAGITRHDERIPWNADAVQIDVVVELPHSHRRRSDFALRMGDRSPALPSQFRSSDTSGGCGIAFRIPTPAASTLAELLWRGRRRWACAWAGGRSPPGRSWRRSVAAWWPARY